LVRAELSGQKSFDRLRGEDPGGERGRLTFARKGIDDPGGVPRHENAAFDGRLGGEKYRPGAQESRRAGDEGREGPVEGRVGLSGVLANGLPAGRKAAAPTLRDDAREVDRASFDA
jgi:hypothetical protein